MHLFESAIDIEASVQDCIKAWRECANAWIANENFLDIELPIKRSDQGKGQLLPNRSSLDWDIAANSIDSHQVLWWQPKNSSIDAFGVIIFDEMIQGLSHYTRITLKITFHNSFKGLASLQLEANAGLMIQRALRQFKKIVSSNLEQKTIHPHSENDELQKSLDILFPENVRKDVFYATV